MCIFVLDHTVKAQRACVKHLSELQLAPLQEWLKVPPSPRSRPRDFCLDWAWAPSATDCPPSNGTKVCFVESDL